MYVIIWTMSNNIAYFASIMIQRRTRARFIRTPSSSLNFHSPRLPMYRRN